MGKPKIEWQGTTADIQRRLDREHLEREIEYLEQTFTPLTSHKLKQELLKDDPADTPDRP